MLKRIDLTRDYQKHKAEYLEAIQKVCEDTAFSGGKYADEFEICTVLWSSLCVGRK